MVTCRPNDATKLHSNVTVFFSFALVQIDIMGSDQVRW